MRGNHWERFEGPVSERSNQIPRTRPWKLLLWTAIVGLVFGLIGFGEIAENYLRACRNSLHRHQASGDIVLVDIDDSSLRQVGRWPWPRGRYAELVDRLSEAKAKRIFVDIMMDTNSEPSDDAKFTQALARRGDVVLPVISRFGPGNGFRIDRTPLPAFSRQAQLGSVTVHYNYQNVVWTVPYSEKISGRSLQSYSALLAGLPARNGEFVADYSLDPASVPRIPASAILSGRFDPREIAGKQVVIGITSAAGGDIVFIPGTGPMAGAFVHIIGAETLKTGVPVDLGWLPLFLLAIAISGFALSRQTTKEQVTILGLTTVLLLFGPTLSDAYRIYLEVTPALFVIITIGVVVGCRRYRESGLVNPVSNLANLNALRHFRDGRHQALVAVRVLNYEEVVATLPQDSERQLVQQIVGRLTVGSTGRRLFQGDAGIFAWFEDPQHAFGNQLEALHSLFRNPARVGAMSIDLSVSFGVEVGSGRSLHTRLASALVAAEEAAHDGLKWKYHDPNTLEDASWKLSILSQLDEAIDRDEVWVAYQPKLDLNSRQIIGAEALARWTHPEKGPIAATEFVAAAEQHNRIGKLTDFVLEKAVAAAAQINRRGIEFEIAVNLSARLLSDRAFTLRLSALLARHGLAPHLLTLELTETAALTGAGEGLEMITRLRDLGIKISIDDYGTGLSTLDYLKKIPATEIKIDQSFVKGIVENRSDRLMVQSTISLAHSLDRKVVAEGIEDSDTLDLLIQMGCDVGQGFAIGRPMSIERVAKRLAADRKRSAA